jgi:thioredoxin 1
MPLTGQPLEFTDANFETEVLQSEQPVIVDFWAETCAPCRLMHPVVRKLSDLWNGRVKVGRLNVFENPATTEAMSIKGIPYLIVVKAGEVVCEMIGDRSVEEVRARIEPMLA